MAVSVGVIGTGIMGAEHVRRIAAEVEGADVVAVADADVDRARAAAATAGALAYPDPLELIRSDAVDAVVIASSDAHARGLRARLPGGGQAGAVREAARQHGRGEPARGRGGGGARAGGWCRSGSCAASTRPTLEMKRALDEGRLGAPLLVHCVHRNASVPPTYTSEMLITSSLTHEIDVVRWLTGEEIVATNVLGGRRSSRAGRDP